MVTHFPLKKNATLVMSSKVFSASVLKCGLKWNNLHRVYCPCVDPWHMKVYGHYRWEDEPVPISTWTCAGWDEIENASAFGFLHPIYFIILWLYLDLAAKLLTPKLQRCFVASETSPTSPSAWWRGEWLFILVSFMVTTVRTFNVYTAAVRAFPSAFSLRNAKGQSASSEISDGFKGMFSC